MNRIIKNPITLWLSWLIKTWRIQFKNRGQSLEIKYMARAIDVQFGYCNTLYEHSSVAKSTLGNYVYVAPRCDIRNSSIGSFSSIGPNTIIGLGMHPSNYLSTFPAFYSKSIQCQMTFSDQNYYEEIGSNTIGNDVWIGANVLIMDNVNIADGAIIAAGSVVTKDVEPYTIVGGVPAKLIRKRFNDELIEQLLELKWWDQDINWIKANVNAFQSPLESLDQLPALQHD